MPLEIRLLLPGQGMGWEFAVYQGGMQFVASDGDDRFPTVAAALGGALAATRAELTRREAEGAAQ